MKTMAPYANKIRWQRVLFVVIALIQVVYAALMVYAAPRTIPALLVRDTGIPGTVLAVLFIWSAFRFARSIEPRLSLLPALLPLALYNVIGLWYVLHGEFGLTGIVAHGGVLVLSTLCLLAPLYPRLKMGLSPLISAGMLVYALGIAGQPTAGTAGYLSTQMTPLATLLLAFLFAMAAGYVFDNHLKPEYLFLAAVPQFLYSLAALAAHRAAPLAVPLNGATSHWILSLLMLVYVFAEGGADGLPDAG